MYTAQEPYLLINNLNQNKVYMCRVAAMTVSKGPYSEVITIELKGYCGMSVNFFNVQYQEYMIEGRRESIVLPVYAVATQNAKSHDQ